MEAKIILQIRFRHGQQLSTTYDIFTKMVWYNADVDAKTIIPKTRKEKTYNADVDAKIIIPKTQKDKATVSNKLRNLYTFRKKATIVHVHMNNE